MTYVRRSTIFFYYQAEGVVRALSSRLYNHTKHPNLFAQSCVQQYNAMDKILKLFISVRLQHNLKLKYHELADNSKQKKKNRKLMKLSHV